MKILVLHGYTQSGPGFRKKIKKLAQHLEDAFPDTSFYYPTAPIQLKLSEMVAVDIPQKTTEDYIEDQIEQVRHGKPDIDDIECYAWFRLHDDNAPPEGFNRSIEMLANYLRDHGPFDGVIGFSQGGLLAIMIASLLEGSIRREAFARAQKKSSETLPFPDSFKDLQHPPFKFGITYGALMGVAKPYRPYYEDPHILTPFCQFSGLWDPVVSVEMTEVVNRSRIGGSRSLKVVHPGAHAVCIERRYLDTVVDFIKGVENYSLSPQPLSPQLVADQPIIPSIEEDPLERMEKGIGISMKKISLSSTSSLSDEPHWDSKFSRRRRGRGRIYGTRKSSWNRIHPSRFPLHFHDQRQSDDSRSDSTSIDLSLADEESNICISHEKRLSLNDALEIFLDQWKQIEALQGHPPSRVKVQEMAARALRMNMV